MLQVKINYFLRSTNDVSTLTEFECIYMLSHVYIHSNFDKLKTSSVGRREYTHLGMEISKSQP